MGPDDPRPIRRRLPLMEWYHGRLLCFLHNNNKDAPLFYATTIMLPHLSQSALAPDPPPHKYSLDKARDGGEHSLPSHTSDFEPRNLKV